MILRLLTIMTLAALFCASLSNAAYDATGEWVTVEGSCSLDNVTPQVARHKAIEDALRKAVEQVVGTRILSETLVVNMRLTGDFIKSAPYGKVVEKEILEDGVDQRGEGRSGQLSLVYRVRLKAKVVKEKGETDPYFRIEGGLNRQTLKHMDKLVVKVKPSRDAYITIFNLMADDKVSILYPNQISRDNLLKGGTTLVFPAEENDRGPVSLKVELEDGKNHAAEAIYILATKSPVHFDPERYQEGQRTLYDGKTAFITDLMREIIDLPPAERAERFFPYEIVRN